METEFRQGSLQIFTVVPSITKASEVGVLLPSLALLVMRFHKCFGGERDGV